MPNNKIITKTQGHVFLIGLNRPEKRNAFDMDMLNELSLTYGEFDRNNDLRCAVLYAEGEHFTAGLDLAQVAPVLMQGNFGYPKEGLDPWGTLTPLPKKPIVSAVQGRCLTLGIELVLATDIRVADTTATFAQIEIKRGIFPFGGGTIRMMQSTGWGNAMRYQLTGDEFDAQEAYRIGLIQQVVPTGSHLNRAIEIATTITKQAPLGIQATLASARQGLHEGPNAAFRQLLPRLQSLMGTKDAQEGLLSFVERREAIFSGC